MNISSIFKRTSGFTLLELSVFIVIASVLAVSLITTRDDVTGLKEKKWTSQKLERLKEKTNRYREMKFRYPCPANPQASDMSVGYGKEADGNNTDICDVSGAANLFQTNPGEANNVLIGTVPFKELGLTEEDALDAWGNRIMYVVSQVDTQFKSCLSFNSKSFITILSDYDHNTPLDSQPATNRAASEDVPYVFISYGKDGVGAYPKHGGATRIQADNNDQKYQKVNHDLTGSFADHRVFLKPGSPIINDDNKANFDDLLAYNADDVDGGAPPAGANLPTGGMILWLDASDEKTITTTSGTVYISSISMIDIAGKKYGDVTTLIPHNLKIGDGIRITMPVGTGQPNYGGDYTVNNVLGTTTFRYELDASRLPTLTPVSSPPEIYLTSSNIKNVAEWKDRRNDSSSAILVEGGVLPDPGVKEYNSVVNSDDPRKRPKYNDVSRRSINGYQVVEFFDTETNLDDTYLQSSSFIDSGRFPSPNATDGMGAPNTVFAIVQFDPDTFAGDKPAIFDASNTSVGGDRGSVGVDKLGRYRVSSGRQTKTMLGSQEYVVLDGNRAVGGSLFPELFTAFFNQKASDSGDNRKKSVLYVNGKEKIFGQAWGTDSLEGIILGARSVIGGGSLDGAIGEIIVYDRALNDEERSRVETYLTKKWLLPFTEYSPENQGKSNITLWLDANDTSTLYTDSGCTTGRIGGTIDYSSPRNVSLRDEVVRCWKDKSGNANNVTASSGSAPTFTFERRFKERLYTNADAAALGIEKKDNPPSTLQYSKVNFGPDSFMSGVGLDNKYDTVSVFASTTLDYTAPQGTKALISTPYYFLFGSYDSTSTNVKLSSYYGAGAGSWLSSTDFSTPISPNQQRYVLSSAIGGGSSEGYLTNAYSMDGRNISDSNEEEMGTINGVTINPFQDRDFQIGRNINGGSNYWNREVREIIVYDCKLEEAERNAVRNYMRRKFGPEEAIDDEPEEEE